MSQLRLDSVEKQVNVLYVQCAISIKIRLRSFTVRRFSTTMQLDLPSFFLFYVA